MELDGQVYTESDRIADLLEAKFPEAPLLPPRGTSLVFGTHVVRSVLPDTDLISDCKTLKST